MREREREGKSGVVMVNGLIKGKRYRETLAEGRGAGLFTGFIFRKKKRSMPRQKPLNSV